MIGVAELLLVGATNTTPDKGVTIQLYALALVEVLVNDTVPPAQIWVSEGAALAVAGGKTEIVLVSVSLPQLLVTVRLTV